MKITHLKRFKNQIMRGLLKNTKEQIKCGLTKNFQPSKNRLDLAVNSKKLTGSELAILSRILFLLGIILPQVIFYREELEIAIF